MYADIIGHFISLSYIYKLVEEIHFLYFAYMTLNVKLPSIKHNYTYSLKELISPSESPPRHGEKL